MILEKPVVNMHFTDDYDWMDYVKSGAAYGVFKKGKVQEAIQKIVNATNGGELSSACSFHCGNGFWIWNEGFKG